MPVTPTGLARIAVALGVASCAGCPAHAQTEPASAYPSHNITLIVPFAAGGPPDVICRILAQPLGQALGTSVVVENRAGASTAIGSVAVARAQPDGYTLLASSLAMVVVPHILAKPGFDPVADFKHVGLTATGVMTLVVTPTLPANTAQELARLARQKPGEIKAAHAGIGTSPHLGLVAFQQAAGIEMIHVPYRGSAPAISDVVAGHVSVLMTAPSTSIALASEGRVRMLGVTGPKRLGALPDVPTLKESGFDLPSLDDGVWFGVSAPAGTPDAIIAKLNGALNKVLADPSVSEALAKSDVVTMTGTPQAYDTLIRAQIKVWRELIAKAGIKPG